MPADADELIKSLFHNKKKYFNISNIQLLKLPRVDRKLLLLKLIQDPLFLFNFISQT